MGSTAEQQSAAGLSQVLNEYFLVPGLMFEFNDNFAPKQACAFKQGQNLSFLSVKSSSPNRM